MGYSPEFLRGVLAIFTLLATAGLLVAVANELFDLGLFDDGYPGGGSFGSFAVVMVGVIAISWALGVLVDRVYGPGRR